MATTRKTTRKIGAAPRKSGRTTKTTRRTAAPRRATRVPRAAKPAAPLHWTDDIHDVNVVWYNVTDLARAKKFYAETLGLPIAYDAPAAGWIEFGYPNQAHIAVNWWQGPEPKPPANGGATVTFSTSDARGTIERLRAKGVQCEDVDEMTGVVILGTFFDPEGNRLQVAQSLMPAQ